MKKIFKSKILLIAIIILLFLMLLHYIQLLISPTLFCGYIKYNDTKYYIAKDQSLYTTIDNTGEVYSSLKDNSEDYVAEVTLYTKNGIPIGKFMKFYAQKYYGDDECLFLQFDSLLFTKDYDLAQKELIKLGDGTVIDKSSIK